MIDALKAVFFANPALAWVFFLGLLGLIAVLGKALFEVVKSLVAIRQDAIIANIARADSAILKLETATSRAINELREAQGTVTTSFNGVVKELQNAIAEIGKMVHETATLLHEKVNTTNARLAEVELDTVQRVTALEVDVRAHRRECEACARICPHRSLPQQHSGHGAARLYQGD